MPSAPTRAQDEMGWSHIYLSPSSLDVLASSTKSRRQRGAQKGDNSRAHRWKNPRIKTRPQERTMTFMAPVPMDAGLACLKTQMLGPESDPHCVEDLPRVPFFLSMGTWGSRSTYVVVRQGPHWDAHSFIPELKWDLCPDPPFPIIAPPISTV